MKWFGAIALLTVLSSACVMGEGYDEDYGFVAAGQPYAAGQDIPKDALLAFAGIYQAQTGEAYLLMPRRHSAAVQVAPTTSVAIHALPAFAQANLAPSIQDDATKPLLTIKSYDNGAQVIQVTYGDASAPVAKDLNRVTPAAGTVYADLQLLATSAAKVIYARQTPEAPQAVVGMFVSTATFDLTKSNQIASAMKLASDNAAKLNQLNVQAVHASTDPDQTGGKFLVGSTLYINAASSPATFMQPVPVTTPGQPQQPGVPVPRQPNQPQQPQQTGKVTNDDDGCSSGGSSGAFLGMALAMVALTARRRRLFAQ